VLLIERFKCYKDSFFLRRYVGKKKVFVTNQLLSLLIFCAHYKKNLLIVSLAVQKIRRVDFIMDALKYAFSFDDEEPHCQFVVATVCVCVYAC